MADRATLIVNPFASRVSEERLREVERVLAERFELTTRLTEEREHATELARRARGDVILAFGGDGLYNEVLNGVDGSIPVGLVPGGGANVLPRALGLPRDPVDAARRLLGARERRVSLGRVNGRRFGFSAGLGIDAEAVRRVDAMGRGRDGRRPGDLAFVWAVASSALRRLGRYEPVLDLGGGRRAAMVFVSNDAVYTYAGPSPLRLCPEARFELGLDFAAPEQLRLASVVRLLARVFRGRGLPGATGVLSGHDLDRLEVRCAAPMPLQADGEDLGDVTEAVFEAERGAVRLLV